MVLSVFLRVHSVAATKSFKEETMSTEVNKVNNLFSVYQPDVTASQTSPLFLRVHRGRVSQVIFSRLHDYKFYYFGIQLHHRV